jgi:thiol-disulfide isomerase/thioredoxin
MGFMIETFLLGVSFAVSFGILIIGMAGKFVGCGRGSQAMCMKGSLDLALALGLCSVPLPWISKCASLIVAVIALGGYLRESNRKDSKCNCFGVLSRPLESFKNPLRCVLFASSVVIIAAQPETFQYSYSFLSGVTAGLVCVLLIVAYGFSLLAAKQIRPMKRAPPSSPVQGKTLPGTTPVGTRTDGRTALLKDLASLGKPLAVIFTAQGCPACKPVKEDLRPVLAKFSFPAYLVIEGSAPDNHRDEHVIYDAGAVLKTALQLRALPAMVIFDGISMTIAQPAAEGYSAIQRDLLRLQLAGEAVSSEEAELS